MQLLRLEYWKGLPSAFGNHGSQHARCRDAHVGCISWETRKLQPQTRGGGWLLHGAFYRLVAARRECHDGNANTLTTRIPECGGSKHRCGNLKLAGRSDRRRHCIAASVHNCAAVVSTRCQTHDDDHNDHARHLLGFVGGKQRRVCSAMAELRRARRKSFEPELDARRRAFGYVASQLPQWRCGLLRRNCTGCR